MLDRRGDFVRGLHCFTVVQPTSLCIWLSTIAAILAFASPGVAEPYVPRDDAEVLESLPNALFSGKDEVAELRKRLASDPTNPQLASSIAARYMELGKLSGDPRFYGFARASLRVWWQTDDPPPNILRLRAKLKEKNHDYEAALADLQLLLVRNPQDMQGWIETSNIYRVQGNYELARSACDQLQEFAGPFAAAVARLPIMAATGQANEAYKQLTELLPEAKTDYPGAVQWFLTMQGELAEALGLDEQAEAHWREALEMAPEDVYLLRAYGEFLLDHGRTEEAFKLAAGHPNDDGLLLCAALAARRLGRETEATEWQAQLASRFREVRQRGDQPLGRFEARCALSLENDPHRALALALANWRVQKEVHDTRIVLEAAIAARAPAQAEPVLDFLAKNHTEHAALHRLVEQLGRQQ